MEQCQRCSETDYDRRTLWMACFYEMDELGLPFEKIKLEKRQFYTLRVCKKCRSEWLSKIKEWFNSIEPKQKYDSGIFIRENGATKEIPEEEWYSKNPGREPVRFRSQDDRQT